jgi:hypothetical protein
VGYASLMRRAHLCLTALAALAVGGCVSRTNAPSVRPTWVESPEGEWQEVMIELSASTDLPRYRVDGLAVRDVDRVRARQSDGSAGFFRNQFTKRDSVDLTYQLHGPGGWRATATVEYALESDITPPAGIGRSNPNDDRRVVERQAFRSVQRLALAADTSAWWTLERHTLQLAPGTPFAASTHRLMRGPRELSVVPVSPRGPKAAHTPRSPLRPVAEGWLIRDGDRPLAVVQSAGGGLLGANDARAWIPSGISAEERRERIAALLMLLIADNRLAFRREH